jgi:hypothetical protein
LPEPQPGTLDNFVNELESSLGEDFLAAAPVQEPAPQATPEPEPQPAAVAYAEPAAEAVDGGELGEFVSDLEASLGDGFLPDAPVESPQPQAWPRPAMQPVAAAEIKIAPPAPVPTVHAAPPVAIPAPVPQIQSVPPIAVPAAAAASAIQPAASAAAATAGAPAAPVFTYQPTKIRPLAPEATATTTKFDSSAGVDLADMFGDLKHELEEDVASSDEDPETHYNLGVAFR